MIRHTLFFTFKEETAEADRMALLAEYVTFPDQFPKMRNFTLGRNVSERDATFQYAFSMDFDNEADLKEYLNSEAHHEHVIERFRPRISIRAIVSYEYEPGQVTTLKV